MLQVYTDFVQNYMALPVIQGVKTEAERFAGAVDTYCMETLMQDGKALQAGTSHFLGQNFAKAFDVKFADKAGGLEYVWGTSWGVSTRLMGALIMAHSDDKGLVLPPKLAPKQVVIVPIFKNNDELEAITVVARGIIGQLKELNITADYDDRDTQKPGWKFAEYELKGVPVRIAIGPRDLEDGTVELARRDTSEKQSTSQQEVASKVKFILSEMQQSIYKKALKFRDEHITTVTTFDEFKEVLENKGGFIRAHWDGTAETELQIKEETKATIRCIPLNQRISTGNCVYSGKPSEQQVYFAKAY
jgi:prolyl-tRNA synthetase